MCTTVHPAPGTRGGIPLLPPLVLCAFSLLTPWSGTGAQTFHVWDGGSPSSNDLGDPLNWADDTVPPNPGLANLEFPDGAARLFPRAETSWNLEGITFTGTSASYAITGSDIHIGVAGIANFSPLVQSMNNIFLFGGDRFFVAAGGPLVFNNQIVGGNLHTAGDFDLVFNGSLVSGSLTAEGTGRLTFAATNNLDLAEIRSGELRLETNTPVAASGTVRFLDGTRFECAGTRTHPCLYALSGTVTYGGTGALTLMNARMSSTASRLIVDGTGSLALQGGQFLGHIQIDRGTLVLDQAIQDQYGTGAVEIGDGAGPGTATLSVRGSSQLGSTAAPHVREDGVFSIDGPFLESFGELRLTGGRVLGQGSILTHSGRIASEASSQTASVELAWSAGAVAAEISVGDGAADPDLRFDDLVRAVNGTCTKTGPGSVSFAGMFDEIDFLRVAEGTVRLEGAAPVIPVSYLVNAAGHLELPLPNRLGGTSDLSLAGGTVSVLASQTLSRITASGGTATGTVSLVIEGPEAGSGVLRLTAQTSDFDVPFVITASGPPAALRCLEGATGLFRRTVTSLGPVEIGGSDGVGLVRMTTLEASQVTLEEDDLQLAEVIGDLLVLSGRLSPDRGLLPGATQPAGELGVEGDFVQSGGELILEIDGDPASLAFDRLTVDGSASLGGALTVVSLAGASYTEGDRFEVLTASSISGDFTEITLPEIAGDLFLEVEIDPVEGHIELVVGSSTTSVPGDGSEPRLPGLEPEWPGRHRAIGLRLGRNPTREAIDVTYSIPHPGPVQLGLFDISGRAVISLASGPETAGTHRIRRSLNDLDLPAGVYSLVLRASGGEERVRVVVVR